MKYINVIKKVTRDKGRKMLDKYKELNDEAKEYIIKELEEKTKDKKLLERCYKEIDKLYDSGYLFMIKYLFIFKYDNFYEVSYKFNGLENEMILFYILGLSTIKASNLTIEQLTKLDISLLCITFIDTLPIDFINTTHTCNGGDFKLYKGSFKKTNNIKENELLDNHYIIIPSYALPYNMTFKYDVNEPPEIDILSTVEDYRNYKDDYLMIKLVYVSAI